MLKTTDFYYELPEELIAQTPIEPRDNAKLLYYVRHRQGIFDKRFYNLGEILGKGDLLVVNDTKVLPARLFGVKDTGAKVEFLLSKRINLTDWEIICKPAKRLQKGAEVVFSPRLSATILEVLEDGGRLVRFKFDGIFEDILHSIGEMPLPPYIREKLKDRDRYQTVYAKHEGSSAAPTAGLHFTPALLQRLEEKGVEFARVCLNVGLGTFMPVKTDAIESHKMHSEYFVLGETAAQKINVAKREGRRVIAVGTTSVRALESAADECGFVKPFAGETNIFIYPPYKFRAVDGLITNFHLPQSTLLMLVSAFISREETLALYAHAIENRYRFFSFGDAMLIL
ncbi:MAG: tRNA preQ1(34) S-adenosylmethionine ribosyltransferase-isomerase QueA [Firmicutes bacterium]|nr:tRNA preQ1(34) S-adenosylmethionine ribosyltransferase-isomerase QueA [Bacillota bacterium]